MPIQIPKRAPQVLLFSFRPEERTMRIIRYLTEQGISVHMVQEAQNSETLGYLFSLPGYEKRSTPSFAASGLPEMLVMHGFDQTMLDAFLRFFRDESIRRVELKAVLTPTNAAWTPAELSRHLTAERDALQKHKRA